MPDIIITTEGVARLLHGLNPNKATGPDDILARILQLTANEIAPALQIIFQKSLDTGKLPLSWSQANIAPIFKKGYLWAAVFTFNPYLLISINELLISIIHLLISINIDTTSIFIDINNSFIDINKSFIDINKSFTDIYKSFIDINKDGCQTHIY